MPELDLTVLVTFVSLCSAVLVMWILTWAATRGRRQLMKVCT